LLILTANAPCAKNNKTIVENKIDLIFERIKRQCRDALCDESGFPTETLGNDGIGGTFSNDGVGGTFVNDGIGEALGNDGVGGTFGNDGIVGTFGNDGVGETFGNDTERKRRRLRVKPAMTKPKLANNGAVLPFAVIPERLCRESKFNRRAFELQ
jgi:hypothetical protein